MKASEDYPSALQTDSPALEDLLPHEKDISPHIRRLRTPSEDGLLCVKNEKTHRESKSLCEKMLLPHSRSSRTPSKTRWLCEESLFLCGKSVFAKLRSMPTNLDLDEKLVAEALRRTGLRTKKAVVEEGLRALIRLNGQAEVRQLKGLLHWQEPDPQPDEMVERVEKAEKTGKGRGGAGSR